MTTELKAGDKVTCARSVLKPKHVRKNGEVIPERLKTTMREGVLVCPSKGGWVVEWRGVSHRRYTEHYFNHEITKQGDTPLLLKSDK